VPAQRYDIRIEVGADFFLSLAWMESDGETPIDLTGYEAKMQVREFHDDEDALLTLTSEVDGGIVLGDEDGTIEIHAVPALTDLLPLSVSGTINGVYDIKLTSPSGVVTRFLEGRCRIASAVTREAPP